jgi:LmbE family N-acetylglucosaminyl deacetylase
MNDRIAGRYEGRTVLVVGAHPDDIEIGIGGTVARLGRAGARVVMALVCIPNRYEIRWAEAQKSAGILGGELRLMLNHGCSRVEDYKTYELVAKLDELQKELKPAALFSHGPSELHKDHTLVYNACLSSQRLQSMDFYCYYPSTCRPGSFCFHPQAFVDISTTLDTKMQAVHAHPSQFTDRGLNPDFLVDVAREQGRLAGVPFAEGFEVVRMMLT